VGAGKTESGVRRATSRATGTHGSGMEADLWSTRRAVPTSAVETGRARRCHNAGMGESSSGPRTLVPSHRDAQVNIWKRREWVQASKRSRRSLGRIWAERKPRLWKKLVDGRRLELPTSALRTRRSPN